MVGKCTDSLFGKENVVNSLALHIHWELEPSKVPLDRYILGCLPSSKGLLDTVLPLGALIVLVTITLASGCMEWTPNLETHLGPFPWESGTRTNSERTVSPSSSGNP